MGESSGVETVDDADVGQRPDSAPAGDRAGFRLAAFGALLIVVLFAGYGIGRLNGSTTSASAPGSAAPGTAMPGMVMDENQPHTHGGTGTGASNPAGASEPMGAAVSGLSLSSAGLTLVPADTVLTAGERRRFTFRVVGAGGAAVTTYAIVHDKPLHLIVLRRDLADFQHLHPTMAPDGTWSLDLTLARPGVYRMIADFTAVVGGRQVAVTLGSDLTVAGNYVPDPLPAPARSVRAGDFQVSYAGAPETRATQPLLISVTGSDGRAAALQPYLGAYGHLVVLRRGDLAYVHVHPEPQLVDGKVKFWVALPSSGTYRMFFDFQVGGRVHTAAWTATID
jgi:hypothetical protein